MILDQLFIVKYTRLSNLIVYLNLSSEKSTFIGKAQRVLVFQTTTKKSCIILSHCRLPNYNNQNKLKGLDT